MDRDDAQRIAAQWLAQLVKPIAEIVADGCTGKVIINITAKGGRQDARIEITKFDTLE